jgi:hypothetical protein
MFLAEDMGVSLKTEQRRSHTTVSGFESWVTRAEGRWGTFQMKLCMEVPVELRRPPSLPLICEVFRDHSSFSVLRETPMAFTRYHFKKPKCYDFSERSKDGLSMDRHLAFARGCRYEKAKKR